MSTRDWNKVTFTNSQGHKLAGLYYTGGVKSTPTLIICHGFTGSKEGQGSAVQMAEYFGQQNYDTLLFDFAGNGESEGSFEDLTLSRQVDDLTCAASWCRQQGAGTLITFGRSFGGSTVICHAAIDNRISGVCTWAAPVRLVELFTGLMDDDPEDPDRFILAGEEGILYLKKSFLSDLQAYDVPAAAAKISPRPLFIIHGTADDVVPSSDAGIIYEAAGNPKELQYIEGGDHQLAGHYRQVWDLCLDWLHKIT